MSQDAIPAGGGYLDGLRFLQDGGKIAAAAREATAFVEAAILAVRSAPDNTFETDEEICGELVRRFEERKAAR
jgi:hypothetical protein